MMTSLTSDKLIMTVRLGSDGRSDESEQLSESLVFILGRTTDVYHTLLFLPLDCACSCQHNVNRGDCLVSAD